MYVNEIFWGLDYDAFPKVTVVENKMHYNEMIVEKGSQFNLIANITLLLLMV